VPYSKTLHSPGEGVRSDRHTNHRTWQNAASIAIKTINQKIPERLYDMMVKNQFRTRRKPDSQRILPG